MEHYVWLISGNWGQDVGTRLAVALTATANAWALAHREDLGFALECRSPRVGEAEGIYHWTSSGRLQILGYSMEIPEAVQEATDRAYQWAWDQVASSHVPEDVDPSDLLQKIEDTVWDEVDLRGCHTSEDILDRLEEYAPECLLSRLLGDSLGAPSIMDYLEAVDLAGAIVARQDARRFRS